MGSHSVYPDNPLFFIVGSTGSGKTTAAVQLAHTLKSQFGYLNVVIVNCDVMQFYEDLPIATNMVTRDEMKGIPHVFMGFLKCDGALSSDPSTAYSGADCPHFSEPSPTVDGSFNVHSYVNAATRFIDDYFHRNVKAAVIVCGGTCYYAQSILFDNLLMTDGSENDSARRSSSPNGTLDEGGLWNAVNSIDPEVSRRYHPHDTRRLKRLLEIKTATGMLPTEVYARREVKLRYHPSRSFFIWTFVERSHLNVSLDERVDAMVRKGLVNEARQFYGKVNRLEGDCSLAEAIGYKEMTSYLKSNTETDVHSEMVLQDCISKIKSNTRRYARQQVQWVMNRFLPLAAALPKECMFGDHFVKVSLNTESHVGSLMTNVATFFLNSPSEESLPSGIELPLRGMKATQEPITQETCALCRMVVCGRGQMMNHLKSKRHRSALRRQTLEREYMERFGESLPPSKRRRQT